MTIAAENQPVPAAPRQRTARRPVRMTLDEFLDPSFEAFAEWVDGKVLYMTVTDVHETISGFLYSLLRFYAEERGEGLAKAAPFAMKVSSNKPVREPDVMYVSNDKMSRIRRTHLAGPADLVVEVVSDDSRTRDRRDKFYEYATAGIPEYWIVDPDRSRSQVFTLTEEGIYEELPAEEGVLRSRLLPDFWVREEWLRPDTMPKIAAVLKEWGLV